MDTAVCHTDRNSRAMLERAKANLVGEYAFVGIMKEMKTNFKILAKIFPSYFGAKGDLEFLYVRRRHQYHHDYHHFC